MNSDHEACAASTQPLSYLSASYIHFRVLFFRRLIFIHNFYIYYLYYGCLETFHNLFFHSKFYYILNYVCVCVSLWEFAHKSAGAHMSAGVLRGK